jgi:hypothetical protein
MVPVPACVDHELRDQIDGEADVDKGETGEEEVHGSVQVWVRADD